MMTTNFLVLGCVAGAVLLFLIITAIQIGKYVYKDAKARGYHAKIWTAVSVVIPYFLGFIGYILMRQILKSETCANCNGSIAHSTKFCHNCGTENKNLLANKNDTKEFRKTIYSVVFFVLFLVAAMIFTAIFIYNNPEILEYLRGLEDYWEQRFLFS